MIFYMIVAYLVFPLLGYYISGKTLKGAGNGFVVGSLVSVVLWYIYGRKLV